MLIAGYSPGRVALLLRLPLEKVIDLYNKLQPNAGDLPTRTMEN
jgi:hypothetical protein